MNDKCDILLEILGPIILTLFVTATAMFLAIPYALERHPLDDARSPTAGLERYHPS